MLGKGKDLLVYLAAPVKQAAGPGNGQMILGGIAQNDTDAAFGVHGQGQHGQGEPHHMTVSGVTMVTEDWDFAAANGEHATLHVQYTRAPANLGGGAVNFYNPADPSASQIFKTQQTTDITRNVTTTPPDRVMEFSYKAGGGKFASLFDGSEKPLSWDSQPIYSRTIGTLPRLG